MPKGKTAEPAMPMYPCGVCREQVHRVFAEKSGGYCWRHEFMRTNEVLELLMVTRGTLDRMAARSELRKRMVSQRIGVWKRAEIEHIREKMRLAGKGWVGLTHRRTA